MGVGRKRKKGKQWERKVEYERMAVGGKGKRWKGKEGGRREDGVKREKKRGKEWERKEGEERVAVGGKGNRRKE